VIFCGWLRVEMNVNESRGSMKWREFNVLINVDVYGMKSAKWNKTQW